MIKKLIVKKPKEMLVNWWDEVKLLKKFKEIEFAPGLNIIFGPNGSGKSTIIQQLARHFMCSTSGYPIINEANTSKLFGSIFNDEPKSGYKIIHDGQVVHYFESLMKLGFDSYGQADWNQMNDVASTMNSATLSSGNKSLNAMRRILNSLVSLDKIVNNISGTCNDVWQNKIKLIYKKLEANCEIGQRTLLLDEPDKGLDIPNQSTFWEYVQQWSKNFQVIVASHNLFSLNIENANYIELNKGYLKNCKSILKKLK